jgi:hypothetical protein
MEYRSRSGTITPVQLSRYPSGKRSRSLNSLFEVRDQIVIVSLWLEKSSLPEPWYRAREAARNIS